MPPSLPPISLPPPLLRQNAMMLQDAASAQQQRRRVTINTVTINTIQLNQQLRIELLLCDNCAVRLAENGPQQAALDRYNITICGA